LRRPDLYADVLIAGAGPAGVALALRLRRLDYDVALVAPPPSGSHAFETLNPTAQEQLVFEGFPPAPGTPVEFEIRWGSDAFERREAAKASLLVDRRAFHAGLKRCAEGSGVRVLNERASAVAYASDGWQLRIGAEEAHARLFVDASGRRGLMPGPRRRGAPLIALHATWTADRLPRTVRLAAAPEGWVWGGPTPDRGYATSVFQDPRVSKARGDQVARIRQIVFESGILDGTANARLAGGVTASDATPHFSPLRDQPCQFRVGDAALALDPLSSSGIPAALQSAVDVALAIHTLSEDPRAGATVETFLRRRLERRGARHSEWTRIFYREAAERFATPFWLTRAGTAPETALAPSSPPAPNQSVALGPGVRLEDEPCPVDDRIAWRRVVALPGTTEPIAFVDGVEIAPLFEVASGATALQLLRSWSARIGQDCALRLFDWAWHGGLVVTAGSETQSAILDSSRSPTISRSEASDALPITHRA
jgi:flavin-dependent dehydrogenase